MFAGIAWKNAPLDRDPSSPWPEWFRGLGEGVGAVALLTGLYIGFAPTESNDAEGCGVLTQSNDPKKILIPSRYRQGTQAIMVLDPLCPACRGFEQRLDASGLGKKLDMQYALFPLDASCNWMLKKSLHPGACAVSEALLCRPEDAQRVLAWAFENQENLLKSAEKNDRALRKAIAKRFPKVKGCLGKSRVKAKLRNSLRWAVANALPILTPQLFVADRRVCDEDTDLGLEYTLTSMLAEIGPEGRSP